jgi:foldase protein PrsA
MACVSALLRGGALVCALLTPLSAFAAGASRAARSSARGKPAAPAKSGPLIPIRTAWQMAPGTPVAFVNGEPITVGQWVERMSLLVGNQTVQSLMQEALVRQEARKQGIHVAPEEVNKRVEEELKNVRSRFATAQQFQEFLDQRKLTEASMRALARPSVELRVIEERLRDKLAASVQVTDKEISDAYESQKFLYQLPEQAHISQILVAVVGTDPQTDAAAKTKADQLLGRAKGMTAAQFADLAKETSDDPDTKAKGGDLPVLRKPSLFGPSFDNVVFSASPGLIPEPVRSFRGYHLVYVHERTPARTKPLDEVKDQIREQSLTRKRNERFVTYMTDLQKNAKQDVRLRY